MENLTLEQLEQIFKVYDQIQNGFINDKDLQLAFDYLPVKNGGQNAFVQKRALNTYVITNYEELCNMKTILINNQTDHPELAENYALEAGVEEVKNPAKPKRNYKKRTIKVRTTTKGRKK